MFDTHENNINHFVIHSLKLQNISFVTLMHEWFTILFISKIGRTPMKLWQGHVARGYNIHSGSMIMTTHYY